MLFGLVGAFTACDSDRDNPTLNVNDIQLVLNTPQFAKQAVDLSLNENLTFTWSATGYTFPYVSTYVLEVSTSESFGSSIIVPLVDNGSASISCEDLNTTLQRELGWTPETEPEIQQLFARVSSAPSATQASKYTIYSNVVPFSVHPTYVLLKSADPEMWYILGGNIGNGAWSNNADANYIANIPFHLVAGCEYDKVTGKGEITYTGYFLKSQGFKILNSDYDWNYAMCGDGVGKILYRNGGDDTGNIEVAEDGYYTINLNTNTYECTMAAYDGKPAVHAGISLSGSFNGWSDTEFTAINIVDGVNNHDWVLTIDLSSGDQIKMKTTGSWDTNWGYGSEDGEINTWGYGQGGGKNIGIAENGTYLIYLNDITGYFTITKQ